jgi:hypothetical protein
MGTLLDGELRPAMRQQMLKLFDGMFRKASAQIGEPGKQTGPASSHARNNEAGENSRGGAAVLPPLSLPTCSHLFVFDPAVGLACCGFGAPQSSPM